MYRYPMGWLDRYNSSLMTILFEVPRIRVGYLLKARPVFSLTLCGLYMWKKFGSHLKPTLTETQGCHESRKGDKQEG